MKKAISVLCTMAMTVCVLAGCSSSQQTQSGNTASSEAEVAQSAEESTQAVSTDTELSEENETAESNTVTDVIGRTVEIPANSDQVVVLAAPAYEKTFILGVQDRVAGILAPCNSPWANFVYPRTGEMVIFDSSVTPNIEDILDLNSGFVICHDFPDLDAQFDELGINYIVTQCAAELPYHDLEGFLDFQRTEMKAIMDAFGDDAVERGQEWIDYFNEKVNYVRERTDSIPEEERPVVYYARSDEGLVTFSRNSYPHYLVEMAGGNYIAKDTPEEMNSTLTIEQIIEWNPDYIFMGRMDNVEIVTENDAWSGIKAVENGDVYLCPSGVFFWDYSGEGVLLMLYMAKTIHPDLFEDLDIKEEIRYYYEHFYGVTMSDENIELMLQHKAP